MTTELYKEHLLRQPKTGKYILCHQTDDLIVVYQAYNKNIAEFALKNQFFGGPDFSYNRMSWIKPNFLWMMFRCGWAEKENQERVLALWLEKRDFETILGQAVPSTFENRNYKTAEQWKNDLTLKNVRLQWDPDHDPYGRKIERRAIQLGLKGAALENFGQKQIKKIEDITDFVKIQKQFIDSNRLDRLVVPIETVFQPAKEHLYEKIDLDR
ncbi:DUF4291 domain-containing protein [Mucilaginibacter ginsenosidivorans]|uniref:DUF4291 domain-containing protein n=1 Tax=Mucilaginibacter ginsenosidivorans TaxID=398053 RepID=A0A5B8V245_9SPHI|nr:DUF4291 domain-containing protein [Mucilaginibacter ginsenosidivorans]